MHGHIEFGLGCEVNSSSVSVFNAVIVVEKLVQDIALFCWLQDDRGCDVLVGLVVRYLCIGWMLRDEAIGALALKRCHDQSLFCLIEFVKMGGVDGTLNEDALADVDTSQFAALEGLKIVVHLGLTC